MEEKYERYHPDLDTYVERTRTGPCFICRLAAGDPGFSHHVIYEDESAVVFLSKGQTQYGYTLVAPKVHKEQVTADFALDEYLKLQSLVYRVSEAVREEVGAQRMYIYTFGSNEGNAHVHWHVVPLPPGVPYEEQQFRAVAIEDAGILDIPQEELASLARRVGGRLER